MPNKSPPSAPSPAPSQRASDMSTRDNDIRIRPGRIRDGRRGTGKSKSFVGRVMRAAKKAGHTGKGFGRRGGNKSRSTFGRGRQAALALSARTPGRRVVIMSRIVRHQGKRFRSAPLTKHAAYLKREGVTRDGQDARMFDARSDDADTQGLCRAMRGRPASFPVHRLARGRARDGGPARLHPGADGGRRTRSRDEAGLGRRRSLEHRQSAYPCAGARPSR